jgi:hypothetical protein
MASKAMHKRRAKPCTKQCRSAAKQPQPRVLQTLREEETAGEREREGERGRERERDGERRREKESEGDLYHLTRLVRNPDKVHTLERA